MLFQIKKYQAPNFLTYFQKSKYRPNSCGPIKSKYVMPNLTRAPHELGHIFILKNKILSLKSKVKKWIEKVKKNLKRYIINNLFLKKNLNKNNL